MSTPPIPRPTSHWTSRPAASDIGSDANLNARDVTQAAFAQTLLVNGGLWLSDVVSFIESVDPVELADEPLARTSSHDETLCVEDLGQRVGATQHLHRLASVAINTVAINYCCNRSVLLCWIGASWRHS